MKNASSGVSTFPNFFKSLHFSEVSDSSRVFTPQKSPVLEFLLSVRVSELTKRWIIFRKKYIYFGRFYFIYLFQWLVSTHPQRINGASKFTNFFNGLQWEIKSEKRISTTETKSRFSNFLAKSGSSHSGGLFHRYLRQIDEGFIWFVSRHIRIGVT